MISLVKFEFKKSFKPLLIWSLGAIGVTIMYMMLYPLVRELTNQMMEGLGGNIAEMMGGDEAMSMLSNYNRYFASEFITIICIFAGYAAFINASAFHSEYHNGSNEFLYTWNFSRSEIFFAKAITALIKALIILTFSMLMVYLCGLIIAKAEVSFKALALTYLFFVIIIIFSSSLGVFISSIIKAKGGASLVAIGIFLGLYLLGALSGISEKYMGWIEWLSPVMLLSPSKAINYVLDGEKFAIFQPIIVLIYSAIMYTIAFFFHKKKDL